MKSLKVGDDVLSFSADNVQKAITKAQNSKAVGPDGLATIMLKHLDRTESEYIARVSTVCVDGWLKGSVP